jgi:ribosomal protein S13
MVAIVEIEQIAEKMCLTLDNPTSVKLQMKQISLAQKQLRAIKKELNATIRMINQQATQAGADSLVSVGLDIFGKHKWAGRLRSETRRAIEREKKDARQPYMNLKDWIDSLILEGDRLKLLAEEYLMREIM